LILRDHILSALFSCYEWVVLSLTSGNSSVSLELPFVTYSLSD